MRCLARLAVVLCCLVIGMLPADARRVALVIGNAAYKVGPLANPASDAAAVAAMIEQQLKFDRVILRKDLGAEAFRAGLREMAREAHGADIALVYFAGHGLEVDGRNFLLPTDATVAAARDIDLEAIALDTVLAQLDGATRLRLVILDACRNNPFAASGAKRSVVRGLARIEPEGGTLVAYAAKDGTTAEDGSGRHSPFTAALLMRMATPGLDVRRMFGYVSDDVMAATNRVQEPYLYGRLGGEEVPLFPTAAVSKASETASQAKSGLSPAEITQICQSVASISSLAVAQSLQNVYGDTPAATCIAARIDELRRQPQAEASAPGGNQTAKLAPPPAKLAEHLSKLKLPPPPAKLAELFSKRPPPPGLFQRPPGAEGPRATVPPSFNATAAKELLAGQTAEIKHFVDWAETPQGAVYWQWVDGWLKRGGALPADTRAIIEGWIDASTLP